MPAYDPLFLRNALLRASASGESSNSGSDERPKRDTSAVKKWLSGLDERAARKEFSRVSPEYRLAQEDAGLDPNRDLELLQREKSLGSNVRAGAEDALLSLAGIGAGLASKIPSPMSGDFTTKKQIFDARRKLLQDFIENREDEINPGRGISKGASFLANFVNPAGKATALNALYHAAVPFGEGEGAGRAFTAGASNVLGEAGESAVTDLAMRKMPWLATLASKIPYLGKLKGLPGNAGGMMIEDAAEAIEDAVAERKKK